ncbi:MAG: type II toxin-antitoxin system RelE/ParE family toxin [Planctomycetes bacterium]|nr:type II toxin-antitoxin system RelE/ParE family toxin [Planctomycetota bacterium]
MARLYWTETALNDVCEITAFIGKDSKVYAKRFGRKLRDTPKKLSRFPRLGGMVPEFERDSLRELFVGAYRVIYEIREGDCYVLAVVHGSRDLLRAVEPPEQV